MLLIPTYLYIANPKRVCPFSTILAAIHYTYFKGWILNAFTFVLQWLELMEIGSQQSDEKLEEVLKDIAINECCTLVYTVSQTYGEKSRCLICIVIVVGYCG